MHRIRPRSRISPRPAGTRHRERAVGPGRAVPPSGKSQHHVEPDIEQGRPSHPLILNSRTGIEARTDEFRAASRPQSWPELDAFNAES